MKKLKRSEKILIYGALILALVSFGWKGIVEPVSRRNTAAWEKLKDLRLEQKRVAVQRENMENNKIKYEAILQEDENKTEENLREVELERLILEQAEQAGLTIDATRIFQKEDQQVETEEGEIHTLVQKLQLDTRGSISQWEQFVDGISGEEKLLMEYCTLEKIDQDQYRIHASVNGWIDREEPEG